MTEAVIFDMDGVLIDSEPVYLDSMLRFARKKNPAVKEEDIHATVGRTAKDTWRSWRGPSGTDRAGRSCERSTISGPASTKAPTTAPYSARRQKNCLSS